MGNGASHWEATDQSGLVQSWEGATGEVGLCPSAASLETQGLIFWREPGHWSSSGASARPVPSYHHLGKVSSID